MDAYGEKLLRQGAEKEREEIIKEIENRLIYGDTSVYEDGIRYGRNRCIDIIKERGEKKPCICDEHKLTTDKENRLVCAKCGELFNIEKKPEKIEPLDELSKDVGSGTIVCKINEIVSAFNDMMARMEAGKCM